MYLVICLHYFCTNCSRNIHCVFDWDIPCTIDRTSHFTGDSCGCIGLPFEWLLKTINKFYSLALLGRYVNPYQDTPTHEKFSLD